MPPDAQDPWETEKLVPINEADITIVDSFFEISKFGNAQLIQVMRVDVPVEPVNIPFETFNNWLGCGKEWVVQDEGARIVKPSADPSKPPKIHSSSNYGKLIDRMKEIGVDMRERGMPTEAKVWTDMRFHVKREVVKYTGLPTAEGGTQDIDASILLPTAVLAATGAAPVSAPAVAATPAPTAAAAPVDGSIESHLISLLLGKSSIIEGKTAAMRDEKVAADNALSSRILENQLIESYFEGATPVLVMSDEGRIARATG